MPANTNSLRLNFGQYLANWVTRHGINVAIDSPRNRSLFPFDASFK